MWRFPSGAFICAIGLLLILVFIVLVIRGGTLLPLALWKGDARADNGSEVWSRVKFLVFVLIGPYFFLSGIVSVSVLMGISLMARRTFPASVTEASQRINLVLEAVLLVCIAFFSWTGSGSLLRSSLRKPKLGYLSIAILLPVAATWFVPAGQYLVDRVQWAAHFLGKVSPPEVFRYFNPSNAWQPWLLLMAFAAFAEEIVFRGMVLPSFIDRYGLYRGMFLTGISGSPCRTGSHYRLRSFSGSGR